MASELTFNKISIDGNVYDKTVFVSNSGTINIVAEVSTNTTDDGYIHRAVLGNTITAQSQINGDIRDTIEQGRGLGVTCIMSQETTEETIDYFSVTGLTTSKYSDKSRITDVTIVTDVWSA